MSLEDATILNGTTAVEHEGVLRATFTLPDGTKFQGDFEDADQMRKKGIAWCESVRAHWKAKEERQGEVPVTVAKAVDVPVSVSPQQAILESYMSALDRAQTNGYKLDALRQEVEADIKLAEELSPLIQKWGLG